jgi:hypothetical protein
MKNVSFVTAVLLTVGEVRQSDSLPQSFSIHDVTRLLRDKVNRGALGFSDRNVENVDGVETYRVEHNDVKRVFQELFDTGILLNLTYTDNGTYRQFFNVPSTVTQGVSNLISFPIALPLVQAKRPDDPIEQKIATYLANQSGEVSLKKIQSRFKDDYFTCRELFDLLTKFGYALRGNGLSYSTYVVAVSPY